MFDLTDEEFVIFDNEGYDKDEEKEFSRKCEEEKNDYLIWGK